MKIQNFLRSLWLWAMLLIVGSVGAQVTTQEALNVAISAASAGSTVEISAAGTYKVPGISKNITVKGTVDGVVFDCVGSGSIASIPNGCTFENVAFNMGTNDYHGFQHAGTINMNDCTFNGKFFSYGDMNFTGCTFNQTASDYSMWDYGKNLTYTNCTFNCNGKFINVYNEGNGDWKLKVEGCTFNSTKKNKAALNIKASCGAKVLGWDVTINNCTVNDEAMFPSASGDATSTLYVGSPIWQVDDRTAAALEANIVKVTLDGAVVYGGSTEIVTVEVPEEVIISGTESASESEKTAAKEAVEELGSNTAITSNEATNVAEVEEVTTLKIEVKNVAVETKTENTTPVATVTKVTYDVQPMKDEEKVSETTEVITFRLPIPQSFTNEIVKVSHNHNGNVETFSAFVQGTGAAKYVELASTKFSEWTIEDNPTLESLEITTANDLVKLSAYVNAGNNMAGKTVKLANDIDMSGIEFTPISQSNYWFAGVFDGQGYTIKNLTVNTPSTNRAALFGGLSHGIVKNFTLDNPQIQGGSDYTAAVSASGNGTIENVTIKGGSVKGADQVGGIAGFMIATTIKHCTIDGTTIEATGDRAGGIIGKIDGQNAFHIDNNTLIGVTVKAAAKHGVCGAGGIASQLMTNTVASGMSIKNNEIDVTTITAGVEEFVPIANLRDGFSMDPVNETNICKNHWVPETTTSTTISNGTSSVTFGNFIPVAQIGDERYASLAEAIAAVPTDGTATTIQMLADHDVTAALTVANTKNITLDLNGKTVKNESSNALSQLVTVNGKLTIDDTSAAKNGKIQNTASGKYVIKTGTAAAVLTLNNGTIETTTGNSNGAVYGTNGAFVMTGGKIIAAGTGVTSKNVNISGGQITATAGQALCAAGTITGGTFTSTNSNAVYANQSGTLEITGGEFTGVSTKPTINIYTTDVKVTGVTLNNGVGFASNATAMILAGSDDACLDNTHAAFYDGETLVGHAPINTGLFANGKVAGKTVKLTKDVATTTFLNVTKSFTLDLNNHNITCTPAKADAAILTKGTASAPVELTIKGEGKVSCGDHGEGCNAIQVGNYSTIDIEGGEFSVPGDNSTIYMLASSDAAASKVNISGGVFKSGDGKYILNIKDDVRAYNTFNVTGGTFVGFNPADNNAEGEHTNFVAEGYTAKDNGDGSYTVVACAYVAQIGVANYATLAEAVAAAQNGETIKMLDDAQANAMVEIAGKNITLDLNGKKISPVEGTKINGGLIGVHNGASLTIDDTSYAKLGTITSGTDGKVYGAVQVTVKNDVDTNPATLVVKNGNLEGYYYGIVGNGARHNTDITIEGGTITGLANSPATDDMGYAIYHPQAGTLTISGGTLVGPAAAIEMRAGKLDITGGSFEATATAFKEAWNGSGTTITGAAIAISQHSTNKDIKVNIEGGTFTGIKALYEKDLNPSYEDHSSNIELAVEGGSFNGAIYSQNDEEFISGGLFSDPNADIYCEQNLTVANKAQGSELLKVEALTDETAIVAITESNDSKIYYSKLQAENRYLSLEDGIKSIDVKEKVAFKDIAYHRTFNASAGYWQAWIAPFDCTPSSYYYDFAEISMLAYYRPSEKTVVTDNVQADDELVIVLNPLGYGARVKANYPYCVRVPEYRKGDSITFYAETDDNDAKTYLHKTEPKQISSSTTSWKFTFNGVYEQTEKSDIYMVATDGSYSHMTNTKTVNPFRWYFTVTQDSQYGTSAPDYNNSNIRFLVFGEDEEATAIMNAINNHPEAEQIYDLSGRLIQQMGHGVSVINGKKVINN